MQSKNISWKMVAIIAIIVVAFIAAIFAIGVSTEAKAYSMEEQIHESQSGIDVQLKKRHDVIVQLVQVVEQFSNHEQAIIDSVTEARAQLNAGNATEALNTLNVVVENYPDITSGEQYKHLMVDISTCEQQISNYRDNYNAQVKNYRKFVRNPINNMILSFRGYEPINADYLEFESDDLEVITDMFGN